MELGKLTSVFAPLYSVLTSCWDENFWSALFCAVNRLLAFPEEICSCTVMSVSGKANCPLGQNISQAVSLKTFSLTDYTNNKSKIYSASLVAQLLKNLPAIQETTVWFLGQEDPLKKGYATHSPILGLPLWLSW